MKHLLNLVSNLRTRTFTQIIITLALILGLFESAAVIRANHYTQLDMYRTIFWTLAAVLNKYALYAVGIVLTLAALRLVCSRSHRLLLRVCFLLAALAMPALVILQHPDVLYTSLRIAGSFVDTQVMSIVVDEYAVSLISAVVVLVVGYMALRSVRRLDRTHVVERAPWTVYGRLWVARDIISLTTLAFAIVLCGINVAAIYFRISTRTANDRPPIIVIMVDTLRADHVGCYGYPGNTTPNIDKFSENAIRFEHAVAQASWTLWSVSSFMTSQYPESMGLGVVGSLNQLDGRYLTLAEILRDSGYRTSAVISNPMWGSALNCDQGFERFIDLQEVMELSSPYVLSNALDELDRLKDERFFLFLLFVDPHKPYIDHKQYADAHWQPSALQGRRRDAPAADRERARDELRNYDSEIRYTDEHIGTVLKELKLKGLYDKSLVIFLSDHGEEFLDHGAWWHERTLYRELVDVPLIIKLPGQKQGKVVRGSFSMINLLPTLLSTVGISPDNGQFKGVDIGLDNILACPDLPVFMSTDSPGISLSGVYDRPHKYIRDNYKGTYELFNTHADPLELSPVTTGETGTADRLGLLLLKHERINQRPNTSQISGGSADFTSGQRERLRSLGYIGN